MTTAKDIFNGFKGTMSVLEKGLQVIHITTPADQLLCCQPDDDTATVFAHPTMILFDQIPVKEGETIVGLLNRREFVVGTTKPVKDQMRPLSEDLLINADMPLLGFLRIDPLDRLVIHEEKMYGLVTRSDFLKLPVRLLAFALVTHIEAQMLTLIQSTRIGTEDWLKYIFPKNREDIQKRYEKLVQERSDPDMLELTYFSDKSRILQKLVVSGAYTALLPEKELLDPLEKLTELRNMIAHGSNSSDDNHSTLQTFIDQLRLADTWIKDIEQWQEERV